MRARVHEPRRSEAERLHGSGPAVVCHQPTGTAIAIQNVKREWQKKQTIASQGFDPDQRQPVCVCNHTLLGC